RTQRPLPCGDATTRWDSNQLHALAHAVRRGHSGRPVSAAHAVHATTAGERSGHHRIPEGCESGLAQVHFDAPLGSARREEIEVDEDPDSIPPRDECPEASLNAERARVVTSLCLPFGFAPLFRGEVIA